MVEPADLEHCFCLNRPSQSQVGSQASGYASGYISYIVRRRSLSSKQCVRSCVAVLIERRREE